MRIERSPGIKLMKAEELKILKSTFVVACFCEILVFGVLLKLKSIVKSPRVPLHILCFKSVHWLLSQHGQLLHPQLSDQAASRDGVHGAHTTPDPMKADRTEHLQSLI